MRVWVLASVLLFSAVVLGAGIEDCAKSGPGERNGCYLAKAREPEECKPISDVYIRDQCFLAIAESYATSYQDCDALYLQHQKLCYARLTFESGKGAMACDELQAEFRGDCQAYFAEHQPGGNISSCETITPSYWEACYAWFFAKLGPRSREECGKLFPGKYAEMCSAYVAGKGNPISNSLSFVDDAWKFANSSGIVMWASLAVSVLVLACLARLFWGKRKKHFEWRH